MKTRKAIAATVLAAFLLSIAPAAFAQSGAAPGTGAAPPKPAAAAVTTPPPAATAKPTAAATTAKPTAAKAKAGATAAKKEGATAAAKLGPRSIIGEVVDPACWIVNGAKGPSHKECAIACAKAGQVLGIVESKTQKLYMIATDKPGEDPNKGLIDYVGQIVLVKGRVYSRGGATGIKVTSVEPYSPTAAVAQ